MELRDVVRRGICLRWLGDGLARQQQLQRLQADRAALRILAQDAACSGHPQCASELPCMSMCRPAQPWHLLQVVRELPIDIPNTLAMAPRGSAETLCRIAPVDS